MKARDVERVLGRLRKLCLAFPEASERLSHGEPTFFVGAKAGKGGKVFVMFSNWARVRSTPLSNACF